MKFKEPTEEQIISFLKAYKFADIKQSKDADNFIVFVAIRDGKLHEIKFYHYKVTCKDIKNIESLWISYIMKNMPEYALKYQANLTKQAKLDIKYSKKLSSETLSCK